MRRDLFTEDHEAFRELARDFIQKEVVPAYPEWEKGGRMPRGVFKQMGGLGMLGMAIPRSTAAPACLTIATTLCCKRRRRKHWSRCPRSAPNSK
jgi:alkylation response protein AidB-like acyl-CoA dehydrogenase